MGKRAEAEAECRKAARSAERLTADNLRQFTSMVRPFDWPSTALGDVVRSSGRAAEAEGVLRSGNRLARTVGSRSEPTLAWVGYELVYSMRRRGLALRDLGDPAGAAADTRQALLIVRRVAAAVGRDSFETACCHAALAGLAGRAGSGVSAAEGEEEAARAMEWLGRAIANGFRNTNLLRIESALDPLRNRADFKKLVAELEKK